METEDQNQKSINNCRFCKNEMLPEATVCSHCNRRQGHIGYFFETGGVIVAVLAALISVSQLQEARKEREKAETALKLVSKVAIANLEIAAIYTALDQFADHLEIGLWAVPTLRPEMVELAEELSINIDMSDSELINYLLLEDTSHEERKEYLLQWSQRRRNRIDK